MTLAADDIERIVDDVYAALQDLERYRDFLHDVRRYLKANDAL